MIPEMIICGIVFAVLASTLVPFRRLLPFCFIPDPLESRTEVLNASDEGMALNLVVKSAENVLSICN